MPRKFPPLPQMSHEEFLDIETRVAKRRYKICPYCEEKYDKVTVIEVDCGVTKPVFDHGSWTCPPADERIPYVHQPEN